MKETQEEGRETRLELLAQLDTLKELNDCIREEIENVDKISESIDWNGLTPHLLVLICIICLVVKSVFV